jgi:hypothetical protein
VKPSRVAVDGVGDGSRDLRHHVEAMQYRCGKSGGPGVFGVDMHGVEIT